MSKISALIFSLNEYELIKPKVELLYPYVNEIVIIDSSTDETQKRLMKSLEKKYKKVRVIWLPPLGFVEAYYKIGINECKYEWILMLDSDDIPSKNLLKDLRELINDKYDAYKIYRDFDRYKLFRLLKKSVANPFCLIHWIMSIKGKNFKELDYSYFIHSKRIGNYKEKLKKYSLFDSFQQLFKLNVAKYFASYRTYDGFSFPKEYFYTFFVSKIFDKAKRSYFLAVNTFLIFYWLPYLFLSAIKHLSFGILYDFYLLYYFLSSPYKRYLPIKLGFISFCDFMRLNNKEEFLKISRKLNLGNKGIENFLKIYEYRLKEAYLQTKQIFKF